jgi:uncharacterized membrane protein
VLAVLPLLAAYLLAFVNVAIYWNNHHHMLQSARRVTGGVLWANLHLLFWLSLIPFVTGWMDENHFASLTVAAYGAVLIGAAVAYTILTHAMVLEEGPQSKLAVAVGRDRKGNASLVLYAAAIPLAFVRPAVSYGLYVLVAALWLVPDRRIEKRVG